MHGQRVNHAIIENSINRSFITAIIGQRRVGKTYFVEHFAKTHPQYHWVFLNMDSMETRKRVEKQELAQLMSEAAKQHIGSAEKIWVVIDEAQKCPAIFDQIKIIYDRHKDQNAIKFIITGSAALSLHQLCAETLAGRIELYHLQEFTLREASLLRHKKISFASIFDLIAEEPKNPYVLKAVIHELSPLKPLLLEELEKQLIWGSFPELLLMNASSEKMIYLSNYLQTYLEKDIRAIETITDLNLYRNMLDVLAEQTGSLRDDHKITAALGCTRDTLKKYRGFLEATLLFSEIYPYISSTLKRLVKSPKSYLTSNGLVSILTGLTDISILQKTGMIGHRLENWFLNELFVWSDRALLPQHIHYWRTASGMEVDFIVTRNPYVFPFEVTYGNTVLKKKIRSLKTFLQEEPKAQWGYYIYNGDFTIDQENKIVFIPCWAVG